MDDDASMLRQFVVAHDQAAFTSLVERHSGLVYHVALRKCGDSGLAEDVTQRVFLALASKAPRIRVRTTLGPWLHRAATFEAAAVLRRERRRREYERSASEEQPTETMPEKPACDLVSLLDERLTRLPREDRELVFLRFYEGRTLPDIAARTGQSLAATQKRSSRLLDRLRRELTSRGHTVTTIILAQLLSEQLRAAAPQSVVTSVLTKMAPVSPPLIGSSALAPLLGILLCGALITGLLLENHGLRKAIDEGTESPALIQAASHPMLHLERLSSAESELGLLTFRTALNRFAVQPASFERRLQLRRAIQRLRPADLPAAAELALNSRTTRSKGFISELFARWAEEDLEAALAMALTPAARRTLIVENGGMDNDALYGVVPWPIT